MVLSQCCGESRSTPFCPMCGKKLKAKAPLRSLLSHLRSTAETKRKQRAGIENEIRRQQLNGKDVAYQERCLESNIRSTEKWDAWADELERLIEPSEAT